MCFRPSTENLVYDIIAGSNNREGNTDHAQFFTVTEVIKHPLHDFAYSRYDIALLRLNRNATIGDLVRTVCLPSEQDKTDFPAGTMCWATGWGRDEEYGKLMFQYILPTNPLWFSSIGKRITFCFDFSLRA